MSSSHSDHISGGFLISVFSENSTSSVFVSCVGVVVVGPEVGLGVSKESNMDEFMAPDAVLAGVMGAAGRGGPSKESKIDELISPDGGAAGFGDRGQPILGGPPTGLVDPDLPLVEVFWRSFLPWNHVEGVPPPNR